MAPPNPAVAVSAPGKVLLAGGYLVLDRRHSALVFGLSARINVVAKEIHTVQGVQLDEIIVESPQFVDAQWRYGYHLGLDGGGIKVTQLQSGSNTGSNPFVEVALSYALTYVNALNPDQSHHCISPARLSILADSDYYSTPGEAIPGNTRFLKFSVPLSKANKTGLGSSAALVTSLTAAVLSHYLRKHVFDISTDKGRKTLHNLAQAAHCAAQGKVGSGFDVAAAVYGSCRYKRFSPDLLSGLPETGAPGFADALRAVVEETGGKEWDVEVQADYVTLPKGVALRMCDVDCGSQTVSMVKKVLAWKSGDPEGSTKLWDELQQRNDELAVALRGSKTEDLPERLGAARKLIKKMGEASDVPIEPDAQTELLDALSELDGVFGGVVPGAGGFDAVALLMKEDEATKWEVDTFLGRWSKERGSLVKLLQVKGEMEGAKAESLYAYSGWLTGP